MKAYARGEGVWDHRTLSPRKSTFIFNEVSMCPARRTVNVKSICPASVNHVSYRVRSRGFSLAGRPLQAAQIATQTFLDSRHNPTGLA